MNITDKNTIELILDDEQRYSTIEKIRGFILFSFNSNAYQPVDLFNLMRNADDDHAELVVSIVAIMSQKYGQAAFMLYDIAKKMIKNGMAERFESHD